MCFSLYIVTMKRVRTRCPALMLGMMVVTALNVGACRSGFETIDNRINVVDAGASSPNTGGTDSTATQVVDGESYLVAEGFVLDAPLQLDSSRKDELRDRLRSIAFPATSSSFTQGLYVGLNTPPEITFSTMNGDGLTLVGSGGPDENMSQILFSHPSGDHGDFLYICANSSDAGDGLFRMDPEGSINQWGAAFNNCNGPFFDTGKLMGDLGGTASFYAVEGNDLRRYAGDGTFSEVGDIEGRITFATASTGAFAGRLWMAESVAAGEMVKVANPGSSATDVIASRADWLPQPFTFPYHHALAFGEDGGLGDFLFLPTSAEVRRYDINANHVPVVAGLMKVRAIAIQPDKSALWILESGRGQVLRLRPE